MKKQLTPFEILAAKRKERAMLVIAYTLTLRALAESIKATGTIDQQALDILVSVANESESRLGISA